MMIWGAISKMKKIANKEAIKIDPKMENKLLEKTDKDFILVLNDGKSKVFGIAEIVSDGKKYYLVRDDVTGTRLLIRDDYGTVADFIYDLREKIRLKLEEKFGVQIEFLYADNDNLIFSDIRASYKGEDKEEIISAIEVDDDVFAIKIVRGRESGHMDIYINVEDFAPVIITKIKESFNFSISKKIRKWLLP